MTEILWPHEPKMFTTQTKFDSLCPQFHEGKNCVHLVHLYFQCPNSACSKLSNPSINVGFPLCLLPTGPHSRHLLVDQSLDPDQLPTNCRFLPSAVLSYSYLFALYPQLGLLKSNLITMNNSIPQSFLWFMAINTMFCNQ